MNRITKHQVLPISVVHERVKQRLFRFMYENNDRDFLDVVALLLEHFTSDGNYTHISALDEQVDVFLNSLIDDNHIRQKRLF